MVGFLRFVRWQIGRGELMDTTVAVSEKKAVFFLQKSCPWSPRPQTDFLCLWLFLTSQVNGFFFVIASLSWSFFFGCESEGQPEPSTARRPYILDSVIQGTVKVFKFWLGNLASRLRLSQTEDSPIKFAPTLKFIYFFICCNQDVA